MSIKLDLGAWNNIFAVPSEVVDKHILIAGGPQLKVLLFILRHSGEELNEKIIADSLRMDIADVKDYISFWVEANLLAKNSEALAPAEEKQSESYSPSFEDTEALISKESPEEETKKPRILTRTEKPSPEFIAERIAQDDNIGYLMQEAQLILSRPISPSESGTLLLLHDNDGLPIDVIMMLLQFCASENKGMRYLETVGTKWAAEGIDSVEKAEKKIIKITESKEAWTVVEKTLGLDHHSPSKAEKENALKWIKEWKFSPEMIREAYEICIDAKGKYLPRYVSKILETWHKLGFKTVEETKNAAKVKPKTDTTKKGNGINGTPSYDIDDFDSYSIFD